jgi:hypothetical protein
MREKMEHEYELTFEWPNESWTWTYYMARDFHEAVLEALKQCPRGCRVRSVVRSPDGFKRGRLIETCKHSSLSVEPVGGKK